jgi:hypothetical protein
VPVSNCQDFAFLRGFYLEDFKMNYVSIENIIRKLDEIYYEKYGDPSDEKMICKVCGEKKSIILFNYNKRISFEYSTDTCESCIDNLIVKRLLKPLVKKDLINQLYIMDIEKLQKKIYKISCIINKLNDEYYNQECKYGIRILDEDGEIFTLCNASGYNEKNLDNIIKCERYNVCYSNKNKILANKLSIYENELEIKVKQEKSRVEKLIDDILTEDVVKLAVILNKINNKLKTKVK